IARVVVARVRGRELEAVATLAGRDRHSKEGEIFGANLRRRLEQYDGVLDDVLQLAHVARPRMRPQGRASALAETRHRQVEPPVLAPVVTQERVGEQLDVLD